MHFYLVNMWGVIWRGGYVRRGKSESTRNRWPSGQEELPGFQLVLVVKHHGVHPGYRAVLKGGKVLIRFVDSLWRPSSIITPTASKRGTKSTSMLQNVFIQLKLFFFFYKIHLNICMSIYAALFICQVQTSTNIKKAM